MVNARARVWAGVVLLLSSCGPCECGEPKPRATPAAERGSDEAAPADGTRFALRYQPAESLDHIVHMVYELWVPGHGVLRTSLSMEVTRAQQSGDTTATEHVLTHYISLSDGQPIPLPDMVGLTFRELRRRDAAFVSAPEVDSQTVAPAISHALIEYIKLATLIEYPDRPVAVGDSWSVPARNIEPAPTVVASLRPRFTLRAVDRSERDAVAEVDSEMEIDIVPTTVAPGITSKGSGGATGHFRVRIVDGVLLEALLDIKLTSEATAEDGTVIGFQEFPGSIHMWVDSADTPADPSAQPGKVPTPAEDPSCVLSLSSMAQRMAHMPRGEPMVVGAAIAGAALPLVRGGHELDVPGGSLVAYADGSFLLDEQPVTPDKLQSALSDWAGRAVDRPRLYVYAHGALDVAALVKQLRPVQNKAELVLVVRDPDAAPMLPSAPGWFTTRVLKAIATPSFDARAAALHELMRVSLGICPPAMLAYQAAVTARAGWQSLSEALPGVYTRCGCGSTDLIALESAVYALAGTPDLRFVPLPSAAKGSVAEALGAETGAPATRGAPEREPAAATPPAAPQAK